MTERRDEMRIPLDLSDLTSTLASGRRDRWQKILLKETFDARVDQLAYASALIDGKQDDPEYVAERRSVVREHVLSKLPEDLREELEHD